MPTKICPWWIGLVHLCNSLQVSGVDQLSISPVFDAYAVSAVLECVCQHSSKHRAEECGGQDTALLYATGDREALAISTCDAFHKKREKFRRSVPWWILSTLY